GGRSRPGSRGRGRRAQGDVLDDRRPRQVGHRRRRHRGRAAAARGAPAPATARPHGLGEDGSRHRAPARQGRAPVRQAHRAHLDGRAQPLPRGAARGAAAAAAGGQAVEPPLRDPDRQAAAALPLLRQRSVAHDARLRLVGRDAVASAVRVGGRPRLDRLRPSRMRIAVVGGGSWGTAFSRLLLDRGHEVTLACRDPVQARAIADTGSNPRYLPEVDLSGVVPATVPGTPLEDAELIVLALPSKAFAGVAASLPDGVPVLSLTKGLDPATGNRLSTLVTGRPVAVLSGPNMAEEIAVGLPTAAVVASEDEAFAEELQEAINSLVFRIYVNPDIAGVELCAAAKNVIALAAGGGDGLGLGDNAKAALITRGLVEMARLGDAVRGPPETFSRLA